MTELPFQFRWASPLGASAALFLSYAALCAAIGIAGPIYLRSGHASLKDSLFFTGPLEARMYGKPTRDLVEATPMLLEVRRQIMDVWCAFALAVAILQVAVVWFGLRVAQPWAMWALAASTIVIAVMYFVLVLPAAGRRTWVSLSQIHPFAWYPALIVPLATVLGWLGMR